MLRHLGRRLGGRAGRRSTSSIIDAAVNAVLAELQGEAATSKRPTRTAAQKCSAVEAPVKRDEHLAAPPAASATPAKATAPSASKILVDVVFSGVNCTLLKHLLSSSSSSSTSTDIPDVARLLRLDYTTVSKKRQLAHLADIHLVNRIHAAVVVHTKAHGPEIEESDLADPSSPLVVLVETNLPREDAEVQEFIIRNALHMHPLPPVVVTEDGHSVTTPSLTVLVLGEEQTTRVRTLAELPPLPPRVSVAAPKAIELAVSSDGRACSAVPPLASDSADAEAAPPSTHNAPPQSRLDAAPVQDAPPGRGVSSGTAESVPQKDDADGTAKAADGAARAADGTARAADGAARAADGTAKAADGTARAADSTAKAADGTAKAADGTARAADGTARAADGTARAADGTAKAADGTAKAADGTARAADGTARAADGTAKAADGTARAADGTARAADGTAKAADGTARAADGTAKAADGTARAADGTAKAADGTAKAADGTARAADGTAKAADGAARAADGTAKAADGTARAADGTAKAADGAARAADGTAKAADGTARAADGTARAADGTARAADGTAKAADGTARAADSTAKAADGLSPSSSSPPSASAAPAATAAEPPAQKRADAAMQRAKMERAMRRVARVSIEAFAAQQKKRKQIRVTPSRARLVAAIEASVSRRGPAASRPPRLLSVESAMDTLLWASRPGQPVPIHALEPLLIPSVFEEIRAAAAAGPLSSPHASSLTMHMVVYGAGTASSPSTVWLGALQAAADLANAVSSGVSRLPAKVAQLAGLDSKRIRRLAELRKSRQRNLKSAAAKSSIPDGAPRPAAAAAPKTARPYVYMLIHTRLSREDAAVLQQELQYQLSKLRATAAGPELAGMSVLTADDVSPAHLTDVLGSLKVEGDASSDVKTSSAKGKATAESKAVQKLSAEGAEVRETFQDMHRLLSKEPWILRSLSEAAAPSSHQQHNSDTLVTDAIRVAALTHVLVQRKEVQLRAHMEAARQSNAVKADSEAVARAAQRVEMKTMVAEAVEEVSVRHQQATAHLVKTLSSMVGQWSLEKLSDTLEAIVRDQVKSIIDVLQERLDSTHACTTEAVNVEAMPKTAVTALKATPAPTSPADSADAASTVLLAKQDELKSIVSQALAQLRELSEQTSALAAAAATAASAAQTDGVASAAEAGPREMAATEPQREEELCLLKDLHERQEQHHSKIREELESLRSELNSLASKERAAAEAQASAHAETGVAAPSPESLNRMTADAVSEIAHAIRQSIHASVVEQLDAYCDVRRSASEDRHGGEPAMPVLPVTSFELEEMLTRVVDHAVRRSTDEIEAHVRVAIAQAQGKKEAAGSDSLATEASASSAAESHEALKAALEGLWARVRAEAAEEEAVKASQHNRQLLRLLRRQQHLQRSLTGHQQTAATVPASPLSYAALEEVMRVVMHPYMAQLQKAVAAASSTGAAASGPSRTSVAPLSRMSSAADAAAREEVAHPAGEE
ncbi:hypothetical protein LSCM1_06286 [Leishmania martiniquensis]|uniref:Uncharacterized protein n=1 Tax=Leishmania martiniquensis TaxID=1580590 RepID=A0A836GEL7_9TRYP|nr:hypothetical protein LSCM1_06286 [Leishmania martiniquensis]